MNIALIGYGKMGKEIERLALERGMTVVQTYDIGSVAPSKEDLKTVDVGIHFAVGQTVLPDVERWSSLGKNLVIGTTGWEKDLGRVQELVNQAGTGLVYASNFSIGVNIFVRLVRQAGKLVNKLPEYDLAIREVHHKEKIDSPSGTALMLGKALLEVVRRKKQLQTGTPEGKTYPEQLHIASSRIGAVVGTHTVTLDSIADTLELTHAAKNRSGFASGALLAAEWIKGKRGVFTMDEVLGGDE